MGRVSDTGRRDAPATGRELIAILDNHGIAGLTPNAERRRARLRALRSRADDLLVPSVVLAEGVLTGHPGHDYHVRRLLETTDVVAVDHSLGYAAGALRQRALRSGTGAQPSAVDAVVCALADDIAASTNVEIVSSDTEGLALLASFATNAAPIAIIRI